MKEGTPNPVAQRRPIRRDAQSNREALVQAAAELFEDHGFSVPLEKVIARAGVGRGTLYRHFDDRTELLMSVLQREMDHLQDALCPSMTLPQAFEALCIAGVRITAIVRRVAAEFATLEERPKLAALSERFERMLAPHLQLSIEMGEIRPDTSIKKAALACQMIGNIVFPGQSPAEMHEAIRHAIEIVMEGLQPDRIRAKRRSE